ISFSTVCFILPVMSSSRKGAKQELPKPLELSKGLKQLYQHQLLCDAMLVCEGRRFSCHRLSSLTNVHDREALLAHDGIYHIGRCVGEQASDSVADRVLLAAVSPYFKDVFTSFGKESQGGEVVLQDMAPFIFQSILQYIYTEELSLTLETAPELFAAASKLQIRPLVEICCSNALMSNELVINVDIKVSSLAHELTASEMEVAVHACRGH
ncbi:unnamed protein product, partial [Eretmochelys imbricata]